jgi:Flp pilus assembly pilin Flp
MIAAFRRFVRNEDGATIVEYGILTGLVAIMVLLAVPYFSNAYQAFSVNVGNTMGSALGL